MIWKKCVIATGLLVLALHGAAAQETGAAPEAGTLQAFLQSLQPPAASLVTPEAAGTPEALSLATPPKGVSCCRAYPSCCSTVATAEACTDLGGEPHSTTQLCALNCCW